LLFVVDDDDANSFTSKMRTSQQLASLIEAVGGQDNSAIFVAVCKQIGPWSFSINKIVITELSDLNPSVTVFAQAHN
jgi:hypothetical protein